MTRDSVCRSISTRMIEPSGIATGPSGNRSPEAICLKSGVMVVMAWYHAPAFIKEVPEMRVPQLLLGVTLAAVLITGTAPAFAADAPAGTVTIGVHVTLVNRWLDPEETEALITPFMVLYALHDALVKPMPNGISTPSLAESWTVSKDGLIYEFVLRKNAKFHNGEPVTADDVKFSFDRYKGSAAKELHEKVKEVQVAAPNRARFVLKEAWPDF